MARDIPIIFSAPMVKALLDGRKTQTRRLASSPLAKVQTGDRLWVRESGRELRVASSPHPHEPRDEWTACGFRYSADGAVIYLGDDVTHDDDRSRPSIHMPRWASRLTLMVEDVLVQRLQDISEEDAEAEGVCDGMHDWDCVGGYFPDTADYCTSGCGSWSYQEVFQRLWDSLHGGKPGESWDANPAVVAISFRVERANIDALSLTRELEVQHG